MFKRENRLVPGIKFNSTNLSASPQFIFKTRRNGLSLNRFGIVVSKKIDKTAVGRNRIKRLLRQTLIDLSKNMLPGHDILLITKKEIIGQTKEEILRAVKNTLEKEKLI